jgi:hypothetical protein
MNFTLEIVTDERNGAACDFKNDQLQTWYNSIQQKTSHYTT